MKTTADIAYELVLGYLSANHMVPEAVPAFLAAVHNSVIQANEAALELPTDAHLPLMRAIRELGLATQQNVGVQMPPGHRAAANSSPTLLPIFEGPAPDWECWVLDILRGHVAKMLKAELTPECDPVNWPDWVKLTIKADGSKILCLEDGKPLNMLKRYLRDQYGLTWGEYVARWNLPPGYPSNRPETIRTHAGYDPAIARSVRLMKS